MGSDGAYILNELIDTGKDPFCIAIFSDVYDAWCWGIYIGTSNKGRQIRCRSGTYVISCPMLSTLITSFRPHDNFMLS